MTTWSERGADRSTVLPTDPPAAHYAEGLFAGYAHEGVAYASHAAEPQRQWWLRGYFAGRELRRMVHYGWL